MFSKIFPFLLALFFVTTGVLCVNAQQTNLPDAATPSGKSRQEEDLPKGIKESLFKKKLEEEKKEFDEMIQRGEEAAKLSEEINDSFQKNRSLSGDDQKKLERLEKLVKKIRDDLGGKDDGDGENQERPNDLVSALKAVHENASNLLSALQKTTRLTISAVAIESSNAVLKLIRFIRFNRN